MQTGLEILFDDSPLGIERIKLLWPSLTVLEKSNLLTILLESEENKLRDGDNIESLVTLAMKDQDPFIRYRAAKYITESFNQNENDRPLIYVSETEQLASTKQVEENDLVRLSHIENKEKRWLSGWFSEVDFEPKTYDPAAFWDKSQTERLILINHYKDNATTLFSFAIDSLLPQKSITEIELVSVLKQYLKQAREHPSFWESPNEADFYVDLGKISLLQNKVPESFLKALLRYAPEYFFNSIF